MTELTKKKIIEFLKDIPDNATVTLMSGKNVSSAGNIQYNEEGNEIIISDESFIPYIKDDIVWLHTDRLEGITINFDDDEESFGFDPILGF